MIDLLLGGSPCQGFSFAGKQLNFFDPRSKLFFDYVKALETLKPRYFLLENVKMKKEYEDIITQHLGVKPIEINSALVSAQNRKRLYWTNIPGVTQPEDKGIMLKDIVHENVDFKTCLYNRNTGLGKEVDKSTALCASDWRGLNRNQNQTSVVVELAEYIVPFDKTLQILDKEVEKGKVGYFKKDSQANRVYYIHGKAVTLCGEAGGGAAKMGQYLFGCITPDRVNKRQNGQRFNDGNKFYTLTAQDRHGVLVEGYIRRLTPIECERLQTLPDNYTAIGVIDGKEIPISNTQRYKMLGNGWTVDVIAHILSFIPETYLHTVVSLFDGISCGQVALERAGKIYNQYYASEIDKYAIAVTQKNYSHTMQLGDVTKIDWEVFKDRVNMIQKFHKALQDEIFEKILEIFKNHFLSSARFRSAFQPHYIAKKEMIEINEQTTTKVEYPKKRRYKMNKYCNKANTVEQFKILQFLEKQFDLEAFEVMLLSRNEIAITDRVGESMIFRFENGKVTWEE